MQIRKVHKKQSGFTLIEIVVAMVVMLIAMSVGIPAYSSMVEKNRLESAFDNLKSAYQFALSEAIKSRKEISICGIESIPSTGNAECVENDVDKRHEWAGGLMVFEGKIDTPTPLRYWETPETIKYTMQQTGQFESMGILKSGGNLIQLSIDEPKICVYISAAGQINNKKFTKENFGEAESCFE